MAPRTRAKKSGKENISTIKKSVLKDINKVSKPSRKPLADKTNSASDDNTSIVGKKEPSKKNVKHPKAVLEEDKPRRVRRVPSRFVGNVVLGNISNPKDVSDTPEKVKKSPNKRKSPRSLSKTPTDLDNSLLKNRPKRISRLPSKLDDHSISPSKFIPVKPFSASTPIVKKIPKPTKTVKNVPDKVPVKKSTRRNGNANILQQITIESFVNKVKPDTNNNPKRTPGKKKTIITKSNKSSFSPVKTSPITRKTIKSPTKTTKTGNIVNKSFSFRILDDKKSSNHENKDDIYEFTFDPKEEPKPQKKKRKRVYNKRPAKPKTIVVKNMYEKNVAQSLQALKSIVGKKPVEQTSNPAMVTKQPVISETVKTPVPNTPINTEKEKTMIQSTTPANNDTHPSTTNSIPNQVNNHVSVRIEDIAAQFEPTPEHHDIDYSPVNSPSSIPLTEQPNKTNDPLNLQQELSFFDEQPVASSSMNVSNRHPTASPWRVEFENLPIKWKVNTYVKPNMTPAYECSYIDNNTDNKKKHIYTNILSEPNKSIPDAETISTQLKQTSIISFIKEVVNRSLNKKKKKNPVTPTKQNSLFEDTGNTSVNQIHFDEASPRKSDSSNNQTDTSENAEKSTESNKEEPNIIQQTRKRKNEDPIETVAKTARKDNEQTLFGFDDSENCDQENVSPVKVDKRKKRNLRSRGGAVLQELNVMSGPTRAAVPAKAKLAMNSEVVNKIYEELKSAATAPDIPENAQKAPEVTNIGELSDGDSQPMLLFEDIELVHHLKPTRKSYGKAKKVNFRQHSSDSDSSRESADDAEQDSYDDLADLSFEIPVVKAKKTGKKKLTKKQKISKKQEQEVDEWAAQFNSMCEDIDNVDLVVE